MKPFHKEAKFILIFFLVLTALTVFSNLDLDSEQKANAKSLQSITNEIVNLEPILPRAPASINENSLFTLNKEFLCKPSAKATRDKVSKKLVIINFKLCLEPKLVRNVAIENVSNGFKAHIFKLEENNYKTDYIQLNDGQNRLKVVVVLKDGQNLEESLEILSGI